VTTDAMTRASGLSKTSVSLDRLRELWFHTGTACNLNCPFCLEGSGPGDTRLQRIRLDDIRGYIDVAVAMEVERFCFTGGEPLIVKDIVRILEYALSRKPCVLLTNGTAPLIKRVHQLELLQQQAHPLTFHVSIDFPDEQRHDAARGLGNFRKALDGLRLLHEHGFAVAVTRQMDIDEDVSVISARFKSVFRRHRLPEEISIHRLPDFGVPGVSREAMAPDSSRQLHRSMCSDSRMVVKTDAGVRVYACTFVDDDSRFDLGSDLKVAMQRPVELLHHRCRLCVSSADGCRLGG
jgi:MoaA/NifB/PqqE/SkfB family radical SAM enzyme